MDGNDRKRFVQRMSMTYLKYFSTLPDPVSWEGKLLAYWEDLEQFDIEAVEKALKESSQHFKMYFPTAGQLIEVVSSHQKSINVRKQAPQQDLSRKSLPDPNAASIDELDPELKNLGDLLAEKHRSGEYTSQQCSAAIFAELERRNKR